jgi:hypothetical protein
MLAAAYPVLFLFATNAAEQVTLGPLWRPLGLAVGTAAASLVALRLIVGDWYRAGVLTTVLVIGFFGYGHVWNVAGDALDSQWPLIGAWGLLVLIGLYAAWRLGGWARVATPALNLVAALLLLMNGWGLTQAVVALGASAPVERELTSVELDPGEGPPPDVYTIVLDRYAGSTALEQSFGFDNEPFLTALEERGFGVARHAHANYIKTPLSVVSSLDLEYLDADQLESEATNGSDRGPIQRRLGEHRVVPTALKELGYSYIHVGNWWPPTQSNVDADRAFRYEGQDEFSSALLQTTIMRAWTEPNAAPDDPYDWNTMHDNNIYALDRLAEIPGVPGPKYVFAHLVTTHPPYVHNVDGSMTGREQVEELGDRESYLRQLQYANSRLLDIVDRIVDSDPDAVIMLQADEGPFPERYDADDWSFPWADATRQELEQKFGILYAMRVPGADLEAEGFHDALTPVNAFRIIFNARFGTDFDLLPDRVYAHTDLRHFYDFIDVTDRLRASGA